jgi:hypothetical protein
MQRGTAMFERREQTRKWFYELVEKFRQKGATSPEKAMTPEELNLPPRFEMAMNRRLGRSGVFVEVNGKYYLSEERLKHVEERGFLKEEVLTARRNILALRIGQIIMIVLFFSFFLASILLNNWYFRIVGIVFLIVWLAISVIQIYFLSRLRRRQLQGHAPIAFRAKSTTLTDDMSF